MGKRTETEMGRNGESARKNLRFTVSPVHRFIPFYRFSDSQKREDMMNRRLRTWMGGLVIVLFALALFAPQAFGAYHVKKAFVRITVNAGEDVETGEVVAIKDSDGEAYLADANVTYLRPAVGIVGSLTGGDGEAIEVITSGILTGWSGLKEGRPGYLSETAGAVTQSPPEWIHTVGMAISSTDYYFDFTDTRDPNLTIEYFTVNPVTAGILGGAATGSTGDENVMIFGQNVFEYHILGAGQSILAPSITADGLDAMLDDTATEGLEISQGITARSPSAFTVGTDAFYLKVKFKIEDISGTADCAIGFRGDEAYQANIDDYNDMAALNVISGDIYIETIDDNAGTTSTDTTDTWGDNETHTLAVFVSSAGAVTYQIDGAAPTVTAAHTIDSGDVVVPFFYMLNDTDKTEIYIASWECGVQ
jgi:hypothetical protein